MIVISCASSNTSGVAGAYTVADNGISVVPSVCVTMRFAVLLPAVEFALCPMLNSTGFAVKSIFAGIVKNELSLKLMFDIVAFLALREIFSVEL